MALYWSFYYLRLFAWLLPALISASLDLLLPKQLSREEREILVWRFEQQMEYREIADRLGISEVGCRSRVSKAIAHCRRYKNDF